MSNMTIKNGVLKKYTGEEEKVVIPQGVTSIGKGAFKDCTSLHSVTIPNTVTEIGEEAFEGCTGLHSISMPDSVTDIGVKAFYGCELLADRNGLIIFGNTLCYCSKFATDIVIPDHVTEIDGYAFQRCHALHSVKISEGITNLGHYAFRNCYALTRVVLPETLVTIGHYAFYCCHRLKQIVFPKGLKSIGRSAFEWCKSLTELDLPHNLTRINVGAFAKCTALTSITIPEGVTSIDAYAFSMCSSLQQIRLPEGLKSIGENTFRECSALTEITIPNSVASVGAYAFEKCHRLKRMIALNTSVYAYNDKATKLMAAISYLENASLYTNPFQVECYDRYVIYHRKEILPIIWKTDNVAALSYYAEHGRITAENFDTEFLAPATEGNAIQCISFLLDWKNQHINPLDVAKAFDRQLMKDPYNATDMRQVWSYQKLEDGTIELTSYKGEETHVSVPPRIGKSPVTSLGRWVFSTHTGNGSKPKPRVKILQQIVAVELPESITKIGTGAFSGCKSLIQVTISGKVTELGYGVFSECEALPRIEIPNSVSVIGECAFWGCKSLTDITLPQSITTKIGNRAFRNCDGLADENGLIIVRDVLYDCINRTAREITIPRTVIEINHSVFYSCKMLERVHIPKRVTAIGYDAFKYCPNVTICAPEGSYAQYYARVYQMKFEKEDNKQ